MTVPTCNRRRMLASVAGLALAATGLAARAQDAPIHRGGVPVVALPRLPETLDDPGDGRWEAAWLRTLLYDAPLRPLASGAVVAAVGIGLGASITERRFDLLARPGVLFANGQPVMAADLGASVARAIDSATPDEMWRWDRVDAVEIGGDRVHLTLTEPDATLAATLASPLVPVTPGGAPVAGIPLARAPAGSGLFVAGRRDGDRVAFHPNRVSWVIGQPRFDGCAVTGVDDVIERTSRLVTGTVDLAPDLPALDIPLLRDDPSVTLVGGVSRRLCAVVLNLDREPLNDVRVRQLLAGVIDRQRLVDGVTAGTGLPTATLFPDDHWAGLENPKATTPRSPGETRDALAALGLLPGWTLRVVCPADEPTLANAAILLQEHLGAAGVAIEIDLRDDATTAGALAHGAFDLAMTYLPPWIDPHEVAYPWLHRDGPRNAGGFASTRVDTLLDRARTEPDEAVRGSLYGDIQRIVSDQVPLVPLFATPWVDAARARVEGFVAHLPPSARGLGAAWFALP